MKHKGTEQGGLALLTERKDSDRRNAPAIRHQMLRNDVGGMILEKMEEAGVSKKLLAGRMGTSLPNVSQILNGNRNLTLDTLEDIAYALGRDVSIIFTPKKDGRDTGLQWRPRDTPSYGNSYMTVGESGNSYHQGKEEKKD